MKKYRYMIALSCVLVGAVGFSSMYVTNQTEKRNAELAKQQQLVQEQEQLEANNTDEKIELPEFSSNQVADAQFGVNEDETKQEPNEPLADGNLPNQDAEQNQQTAEAESAEETQVGTIIEEKLSFTPKTGVVWPIEGSILLDYSMESTIFFPTLQQYQYNPAMILSGNVNDKVYFIAKGKITNIETNEVTGCTVTQDLGDGYTAIYGQLKELNFEVGEMVESGQVVGYISEPTKYYAVEGSNVYFQLLKDGQPIDPAEVLP